MNSPVDPTSTPAWAELENLHRSLDVDFRKWFAEEPNRAQRFTLRAGDLTVDLSRNYLNQQVRDTLVSLAAQVDLAGRRDAMFRGDRINTTEDRSVLHVALRLPKGAELDVDGVNVVDQVHEVLDREISFAEAVRSGERGGVTGKPITTVVNIGIGGSDLGPVMVYEALKPYKHDRIECRFISNIDPADMYEKTHDLDAETTLFIVASKTFTTLETMTNARMAKNWLINSLQSSGAIDGTAESRARAIKRHFVAVSTNAEKVSEFGIDHANMFGFWDWVGGRYSVDSAVGLSALIAIGPDNWQDFLEGFLAIDKHFMITPIAENVPALMGLLNVFYSNFYNAQSHVVLPYSQYLHRFPAYLQQLTMESNGKSTRWDASPVTTETGEIFWGEPGTNGQHAFYQLLHQGTRVIPADFIGFARPAHALTEAGADVHDLFMSNFFAQTQALAFGKTADEVRAEGTPEPLVPARVFSGNRPTTSILAPELSPRILGELIALYEHITFTEGAVWGIDSFDQWGVELGKTLAKNIAPLLTAGDEALMSQDSSTMSLIRAYKAMRAGNR
ncbi:glucose-6-phosphate isomerase [Propionibacterium freudenreichii]|uniref:glucose-6-phosphate isomerase n=1 Tax=Propionibacterium freudenreichii TaxID=1744 RepID=UPI0005A5C8E8|nr:glucose-6-phosphate isomerase [Propionibacterium freudenreichii]MDK9349908.1 glucose-6-phosphate isomerase [Propionibacterium freudenreichii]MDK9628712.1 glucose-6-phosphate isomerase [Propionibacterium freudenreichii]MDK9653026.1 glucose-6-phosphate isomerase [Propionibacterium freudenreichii]CEI31628.1 Glucose-6-phosphate isomerase (GPI) (Phosphoglucose isomerase) (PGI) (Phosphohexose isomerase) (PHI) [Propionibacterium freudenreichii]SBN41557.1 Glucose-6-phosphate isomerase 2 [Propioniba